LHSPIFDTNGFLVKLVEDKIGVRPSDTNDAIATIIDDLKQLSTKNSLSPIDFHNLITNAYKEFEQKQMKSDLETQSIQSAQSAQDKYGIT